MGKSSTQSQSSNSKSNKTKTIKKSKAPIKSTQKNKSKQHRPQQIQYETLKFWEKKVNTGASLLKVKPKIGKYEQQMREELALAYRVCHHEKLNEGCDNHLSVMLTVDGYEAILTLPHGILWSQTKPEDFILVDYDGNILRPSGRKDGGAQFGHIYVPDISAIKIHGHLHRDLGEKRAKCVLHTHQPNATALCSAEIGQDELKMCHQNSCRFYKGSIIYYREFNGIANNDEEGKHLVSLFKKKGNEQARILQARLHGPIVAGPSIAHAMHDLYFLEIAAREQCDLMKMGQDLNKCLIDDEVAKETYKYDLREKDRMSAALFNAWSKAGI